MTYLNLFEVNLSCGIEPHLTQLEYVVLPIWNLEGAKQRSMKTLEIDDGPGKIDCIRQRLQHSIIDSWHPILYLQIIQVD